VAFDILWLDDADLRSLPLSERRQRLQGVLSEASAIVSKALSVTGHGCELFDLMCASKRLKTLPFREMKRQRPRSRLEVAEGPNQTPIRGRRTRLACG
jgi:hypothetical protein